MVKRKLCTAGKEEAILNFFLELATDMDSEYQQFLHSLVCEGLKTVAILLNGLEGFNEGKLSLNSSLTGPEITR
jgi:hypothetical protein